MADNRDTNAGNTNAGNKNQNAPTKEQASLGGQHSAEQQTRANTGQFAGKQEDSRASTGNAKPAKRPGDEQEAGEEEGKAGMQANTTDKNRTDKDASPSRPGQDAGANKQGNQQGGQPGKKF